MKQNNKNPHNLVMNTELIVYWPLKSQSELQDKMPVVLAYSSLPREGWEENTWERQVKQQPDELFTGGYYYTLLTLHKIILFVQQNTLNPFGFVSCKKNCIVIYGIIAIFSIDNKSRIDNAGCLYALQKRKIWIMQKNLMLNFKLTLFTFIST